MTMSKEGPWIRFFPSDWLAGTRGLSAAETGVYITLVSMMYERGAPIAYEPTRLARLCGTTSAALKSTVSMLLDAGKLEQKPDGLWNGRVEKETVHRRDKSQQAAESAETRWQKDKQKQRSPDADAMRMQSERNANQKPEPDVATQRSAADRLIEAASSNGGCHPNLVTSISQAFVLLERYDLEREFLPVVREKASPTVRSWKFFGAVAESNAALRQATPPRQPTPAEDWAGRMAVWRDNETWGIGWGPKPGEKGCRVPPQLLNRAAA
jgi:uncharacterized protein YdaU (DUF1376 family)